MKFFSINFFSFQLRYLEMLSPNHQIRNRHGCRSAKCGGSAKAFSLPEGIKVKVWASEPMVQNPIAMHGINWQDVGCGKLYIREPEDTV